MSYIFDTKVSSFAVDDEEEDSKFLPLSSQDANPSG
jgi:hypothetical protein